MKYPNLSEEKRLWKKGYKRVACLDEAGRGPLAGPVVAAAVALLPISNSKFLISKQFQNLKDSKQLTPKQREKFYKILIAHPAIGWGIEIVSEKVIDRINIFQATKLAMTRAVLNLQTKLQKNKHITKSRYSRKTLYPDFLIVDGNRELSFMNIPCKAIIRGDEKIFSCALASIIAKVTRDRMMVRYHKKYPQYGFDRHKGYGTPLHFAMLRKYGSCEIHRKSFQPVVTMLKSEIRISKFETNSKFKSNKF